MVVNGNFDKNNILIISLSFLLLIKKNKEEKLRKKGYKPEKVGDLVQMDSITILLDGLKRQLITAIDFKSRFFSDMPTTQHFQV